MSFYDVNVLTRLPSYFNEQQWVKQICDTLDQEFDEETEVPISIFSVPKPLMDTNPMSYTPQQVAIGPYHQLCIELYDMQRYKVAAAKRNQKELQGLNLKGFVDRLLKHELQIRASYHKPLNYGGEALAWMMAIDASFLLEFFQVCGVKKGKVLTKTMSRLAYLTDLSGNKIVSNLILQDISMLENQIPLFVLRMLLEFQLSSVATADGVLLDMFIDIVDELYPFMLANPCQKVDLKDCVHFLDFLYHFIVPKLEDAPHDDEIIDIMEIGGDDKNDEDMNVHHTFLRTLLDEILKILRMIKDGPVDWILTQVKMIVKLPMMILSKVPILKVFKEPIEKMFQVFSQKDKKDEEEDKELSVQKPPVLEEIDIPSVAQLVEVGVKFLPTNECIKSIAFDPKTLSFHMPIIKLDVNSNVVLRNLVAFEACKGTGPLVLSRYTEMMNGIVDTETDVEILCQNGIIINHLKSKKEVADIWNGMNQCIKMTKVPTLDRVIKDVNKFYNGTWKVKRKKMMERYIYGSWRILVFLATISLLLLLCLQSFCQVYSCHRFIHITALEPE